MHELISRTLFDDAVARLTPELCSTRGWVFHKVEFPIIEISFTAPGRTTLRVRVDSTNWNDSPLSIEFRTEGGSASLHSIPQGGEGQFNASVHPSTGRPFICMAGALEYHMHPSHIGDPWDTYKRRSGYDLGGILTRVWRAWEQTKP